MTSGILGVLACPMLENELLYSLSHDGEEKTVYVVDNEDALTFKRKADRRGFRYTLIPEKKFCSEDSGIDRSKFNVVIFFNPMALHAEPENLRKQVEEQIVAIQPYVDSLAVYYGMCGSYGWNVEEFAREKGLKPTFTMLDKDGRVCDDCVGVAIDGGENYTRLAREYTGMLYLIPTVASNWREFFGGKKTGNGKTMKEELEEMTPDVKEYFGITDVDSYMRWMFSIAGYQHGLIIDTGLEDDRDEFVKECDAICRNMNLTPIEIGKGWASLYPAETIYRRAKDALTARARRSSESG